MKKRFFCMVLTVLLTLSLIGPVPVLATETSIYGEDISSRRADELIYYYRTYNGVRQYRIWNATDGYWVTPWLPLG